MFPNIRLDLFERPVCKGIDFDQPRLIDFNDIERSSGTALGFSTTGEDGADVKLGVCSTARCNFDEVVVLSFVSGPEFGAVGSDEGVDGWGTFGSKYVELGCWVSTFYFFEEGMCFGEMMECVNEDERYGVLFWGYSRKHVCCYQSYKSVLATRRRGEWGGDVPVRPSAVV